MNELYSLDIKNTSIIKSKPGICLDYPDPDVIRVGNTYYMVSTTMHFFPGCEILKSNNLINWDHACYVYEKLDSTDGQTLSDRKGIYGKGMWAATIRYHENNFYIMFVCNDTEKTYLYTYESIDGILDESCSFKWNKRNVDAFYHDCSLLFDTDSDGNSHIYVSYGNTEVYLTELAPDFSGPLEGGLHRLLVSDKGNTRLGFEGSHLYKINDKYYLFLIHSTRDAWKRTEACFISDSITGQFVGGDILNDDWGYCNSGIAQGGIVDTPEGNWYAMMFQDRGAVGRIPILTKMHFENDKPVIDKEYSYLETSNKWQFNHEPDLSLVSYQKIDTTQKIQIGIKTNELCNNILAAKNTYTARLYYPTTDVSVSLDISSLNDGDHAGLAIFQGCYGLIGIKKANGKAILFIEEKKPLDDGAFTYEYEIETTDVCEINTNNVRLGFTADFTNMKDEARFYYCDRDNNKILLPLIHKMYFKLDHFTGNRVALFMYSTKQSGGEVRFQMDSK